MKAFTYKHNRNYTIIVLLLFSLITGAGCGKGGGSDAISSPTLTPEASLVFTINPDPGTTIFTALSSNQDIAVSITSPLPSAGVTIDILVTKDLDNSIVFSQTLTTTTANFTASLQNLSGGTVCTVTIALTSKSSLSNKATKSFKIAKK